MCDTTEWKNSLLNKELFAQETLNFERQQTNANTSKLNALPWVEQ